MSKNGASILVVDDEREIVRALRRALKRPRLHGAHSEQWRRGP